MPDLGPYAGTIIGAYLVTLALLGLLVAASLRRASAVRRDLGRLEAEIKSEKAKSHAPD